METGKALWRRFGPHERQRQYLLTALEAIYDEFTVNMPCKGCGEDCPLLDSFGGMIENMKADSSRAITSDLGMKPVDWNRCHKFKRGTQG